MYAYEALNLWQLQHGMQYNLSKAYPGNINVPV